MARKRAISNTTPAVPANDAAFGGDPGSSGAMDSLLEKLRAAAPQARGQRDRRRRARLKEKHQVRVASGQKIPDDFGMGDPEDGEDGEDADNDYHDGDGDHLEPHAAEGQETGNGHSEGEDVADRAASMLQGLRNHTDSDERARKRRESADEERRNRRRRRRTGGGISISSKAPTNEPGSPTKTDTIAEQDDHVPGPNPEGEQSSPPPPSIVVSSAPDPKANGES